MASRDGSCLCGRTLKQGKDQIKDYEDKEAEESCFAYSARSVALESSGNS